MQNGLTKRLKTSQAKGDQNAIKETMISRSKAVALEVGDMVLVCVTTFKGWSQNPGQIGE